MSQLNPTALTDPTGAPTRWTKVLRAQGSTPEARAALGELCESYWATVHRFLRSEGRDDDKARELTQEFFRRLLAGEAIRGADPARGRFRSYLLGAVKHFLADQRRHEQRLKRGGGMPEPEPLPDPTGTSGGAEIADPREASDRIFDRAWALSLMERGLNSLASEFEAEGRRAQFDAIKPWLVGETPALPQAETARRLGCSESALKVAIHRLRKRFRELIRIEITQTVPDPSDVESELRYLVDVLCD